MSSGRTLPIRLAPLAGEPVDGWLEAYAHRLDVTVGDLLAALGLRVEGRQAPDFTVCLRHKEVERIATLTGVSADRLNAMTVRLFDGHVVALHPRRRAVIRSTWWGRGSGSRYCPHCLSERDGRWKLRWRLSWVFACTRHRVLLHDTCPGCGHSPRTSVMTITHDHTPGTCPRRGCRTNLRDARPLRLGAHDPLLAAQARIDTILGAVETGHIGDLATAPAAMFTDLRTVAGWLLRQADPDDFHAFGPRVEAAWRDAQARYTSGVRPSQFPPTDASLMGATTARALNLIEGDDDAAIAHLRILLRRSPHRPTVCPPGLTQQWSRISEMLRGRFLRAGDPDRGHVDRLRYRSCIATARVPEPDNDLSAARERHVPQLLWPGWTIRLLPPQRFHTGPFRMVMSACLLLPGEHGRRRRGTPTRLHPHLRQHLYTVLHLLANQGQDAVLAALCHLADYLDEHGSPIDYRRRRTIVTPAILGEPDWLTLCQQASAHPGLRGGRFRQAQRYLIQLLSGADLSDPQHSLAFQSAADRTGYYAFTTALTAALRVGLHDHAANYLHQHDVDEPLTWEPPADCCPNLAQLPGRDPDDIDLDTVQRIVIHDQQPARVAADHLNTTIDHIRLALERIPRTPTDWAATASPAAWQRRQHARRMLTPTVLHREYISCGKRLRQIADETGIPRHIIAELAREDGIDLIKGRRAITISEAWLRECYLRDARSTMDIASELGISAETVTRNLQRYGIPVRPAGVHSRTEMLAPADKRLSADIRRAVEGSLHGWQRLQRFHTAMAFPTIEAAAKHLGAHQAALVRQFQRLEHDIGTLPPLRTLDPDAPHPPRQSPTASIRPTPRPPPSQPTLQASTPRRLTKRCVSHSADLDGATFGETSRSLPGR